MAVWDGGHAGNPEATESECGANPSNAFLDETLLGYRGGPYSSTDNTNWTWRLVSTPSSPSPGAPLLDNVHYRCSETTPALRADNFHVTQLHQVEADPTNSDHIILGAYSGQPGLYRLPPGAAAYKYESDPTTVVFQPPFTSAVGISDNQGYGLEQYGPPVFDLAIESWGNSPRAVFSHYRGVHMATLGAPSAVMENLAFTWANTLPDPDSWESSGLDNTCAFDLAQMASGGDDFLFLGAADGGLFRTADATVGWQRSAELIDPLIAQTFDDAHAVLVDGDDVYVTHSHGTEIDKQAVLKSTNRGEPSTWAVIGGDAGPSSPNTHNLDVSDKLLELAPGELNASGQRELLLGTAADGLWHYDPARTPAWQPVAGTCPAAAKVASIVTDGPFAYATFDTTDPDRDGVYRLDLATLACLRLDVVLTGCSLCEPTAVALVEDSSGTDHILAAGRDGAGGPAVIKRWTWTTPVTLWGAWAHAYEPSSDLDPSHPDNSEQLDNEERLVTDFEEHPTLPGVVVATLSGKPYKDGYHPTQLLVSEDAGETWMHDPLLASDLPGLNLRGTRFVEHDGKTFLYALGDCTSVYRTLDPWQPQ